MNARRGGITRAGKRALAFVKRAGNKRKGWNAFNSSSPVPAAEGAATLTALTPQVPMPSPSEMADVVGALKYDLSPKVFGAELDSLRSCVGTGTLHSSSAGSEPRMHHVSKSDSRRFSMNGELV